MDSSVLSRETKKVFKTVKERPVKFEPNVSSNLGGMKPNATKLYKSTLVMVGEIKCTQLTLTYFV